ncbi:MAG: superoxide dismutase [Pseudomonadota bacterium]|uniref:superoxide dismutase n=1 Tax=Thermithiobacillus tepidarius TaxID=929 RepID=UPI000421C4BC|nr:Fe-Mn family superoxide dismutase [Thermithiobacillus tepidarius]
MFEYTVREELKPSGLNGISDEQIEDHWGLYKGYVAQSNALRKELADMRANGQSGSMAYADRRRRYGFEYNGMVLHEYYFGHLKAGVNLNPESGFAKAVAAQFGSLDAWKTDLMNTGKTRGIGWAVTYYDPTTDQISNHFIQLHEDGNVAGFQPLVILDVFEHAYMVDHKAAGRPAYIEAFMNNIDWDVVEQRYQTAKKGEIFKRY